MSGSVLAAEASRLDPWIAASINPRLFWTLVLLAPLLSGYLLARRYRSPGAQVSFILAGPAAWIIGALIYDPDPGCDYDCVGRLAYGFALTFGAGACGPDCSWPQSSRRRRPVAVRQS
jgi:hypothetical protein